MRSYPCKTNYSRRDFLKLAASVGSAAAFLQACTQAGIDPTTLAPATATQAIPPSEVIATATNQLAGETQVEAQPTSTPTEAVTQAPSLGTGQVAFIKTRDRALGVRQAIELCGLKDIQDQQVFLKPNYNSGDPTPGATHPDVLRSLLQILGERKSGQITVGDRSGMGDTHKAMQRSGVFELQEQYSFNTLIFDDLGPDDWVMIQPPDSHWSRGFPFARPILEADTIIQTCCLKTHQFGGHFTLSLKNTVGMVAKWNLIDDHNFMTELHNSPHQRRMIAEINTAYQPDLVVMDGVECFIDGGPATGRTASSEVFLAATDRVALDAVGVALLRFHGCKTQAAQGKIFEQEQIERAVALGLGVDSPDQIEIITADADSAAYADQILEILTA